MIDIVTTALQSKVILILTIIYFFVESIATYDMRINQYFMTNDINRIKYLRIKNSEIKKLPSWVAIFIFIGWGIFIYFIFVNWKYAIIIIMIRFVLKVLPVLETIGEIIMTPFDPNKKRW